MNVELNPEHWRPTGVSEDATARLLYADFRINGCQMHLEAYAVVDDEDGEQVAADPEFSPEVDKIQSICDCALSTQTINGREYIVVAYPYGV